MREPVSVGSTAPDFVYATAGGAQEQLSQFWRSQPALVLWLRHFGRTFFAESLVQLREKLPQFEALGVRVVCVVQGTAEEAQQFCARHGLAQGCIGDPGKESYRAMGFGRTNWKEILFASRELKQRREEASAIGCGVSLKGTFQKHSDVLQLPGAALVERGGRILWLCRPETLAGLPRADELLRIVKEKFGK